MGIAVAVVAHEAEHVLPGSCMVIGSVADGLVGHHGCFLQRPHGVTPHCHIGLTQKGRAFLYHFLIIEQTEEIIADEAVDGTERIVALETEQEVISIIAAPLGTAQAVIPRPVAVEQQVSGKVSLRCSPVVEHLHVAAIGCGIRGSAAELVIQLIGRHDPHAQAVALLVQCLDALSLCQPPLGGGDDDDHIHSLVGMMILIRDTIHVFWHRERLEIGFVLRGVMAQGDVVESQISACRLSDAHGVLCLQDAVELILKHIFPCLRIAVEGDSLIDGTHHRVVYFHLRLIVAVGRQSDCQSALSAVGCQRVGLWRTDGEECLVEEVSPSVIPGIVVHLVKAVIIVIKWIVFGDKCLFANVKWLLLEAVLAICQEVVAFIRIRIARAHEGVLRFPRHGACGMEYPLAVHRAGGHLLQIVGSCQIVACQPLRLQASAIAVDSHLADICKACFLDECLRQLVEATRWHSDLRPVPLAKHGVGGIARIACTSGASGVTHRSGPTGHLQHKADELLISAVAIDQRDKRHVEHALLAHHAYRLMHWRHRLQGGAADLLIALDISLAHINKLRILDGDGIDRIGITGT